jgi:hypothetical protein
MSRIRADKFVNNAANGAPELTYGAEIPVGVSLIGAGGINITGVATATSFSGDGSGLIGVASTDNIITSTSSTFANINSTGIITATSFSGDGVNLTNVGAAQSTRTLQVWLFGGG